VIFCFYNLISPLIPPGYFSKILNNINHQYAILRRLKSEAKAKQRIDLFEVIRSGNLAKVKAFIGDTLDNPKYNGSNKSGGVRQVDVRTTVMREFFASQPLLHNCIGESAPHTADNGSKGTSEGRLSIAKYLLDLHTRPLDLGITDDDGRTILHLAAKREDSAILKLFLLARDDSPERRNQLDINARCSKSGWTALHYAASQGNITSVRLLLEAGASLSVHAGIGKGATPLDVTKSRLQNAGHFSAAHIANLHLVSKEISDAIRAVEKVKQQKEAERLLKEEKLAAARKVLAEREERERELLERKQKQLKEKQERDRMRDDEENSKKLSKGQGPVQQTTSSTGTTKGTTPSASAQPVPATAAATVTPSTANKSPSPNTTPATGTTAAAADSASKSLKKKIKKGKKKEEETVVTPVVIPAPRPSSAVVAVVDVASRDELVDHLLAMGFPEPDCLAAISLYGRDLDRALSWLCDRPSVPPSGSATGGATPGNTDLNSSGSSRTISRDEGSSSAGVGNAVSSVAGCTVGSTNTESMRVQKEKDLKEELRRINRAWNRKAEDEKKKVSSTVHYPYFIDFKLRLHFYFDCQAHTFNC
jgi:Ankyrin repeats (3 copies)